MYCIAWSNQISRTPGSRHEPLILLASGNTVDGGRESGAWWSLLDLLYILLQPCGELKCGSVSSTLRRPLGKSIVHLIGFLDAGFVRSFLPTEIGFTWQG